MDKQIFITLSFEEFTQTIKDCVTEVLYQDTQDKTSKEVPEELLTISDVQEIFQVSKVTIHKWKKLGLIPFYKVNRKLYFKKSEILESLKEKQRKLAL